MQSCHKDLEAGLSSSWAMQKSPCAMSRHSHQAWQGLWCHHTLGMVALAVSAASVPTCVKVIKNSSMCYNNEKLTKNDFSANKTDSVQSWV